MGENVVVGPETRYALSGDIHIAYQLAWIHRIVLCRPANNAMAIDRVHQSERFCHVGAVDQEVLFVSVVSA